MEQGLNKTKKNLFTRIFNAISSKATIDDEVLDEIEEALIRADVGVDTTVKIIDKLEQKVNTEKYHSLSEVLGMLKGILIDILELDQNSDFALKPSQQKPKVVLMVGVNGVGKTTSIGKLSHHLKTQNYKVILGAADTFRAAAVEQLTIWSERVAIPIIKQKMGADPAAVTYDAVQSGIAKQTDFVIVDTAGRLHNKVNLMRELTKIKNAIHKVNDKIEVEVMLVLDGSTGQNSLEQAKQFVQSTEVNSLIITKLDGSAKGGFVLGVVDKMKIPIRYIGTGEKIEDFKPFDANTFVNDFFDSSTFVK